MEFDILEQNKNDLLEREELRIRVMHPRSPTPKKLDVLTAVCAKKNFDVKKTLIKDFVTIYGTNRSEGMIYAYDSESAMENAESGKVIKKATIGAKKEEEKAPEKTEAAKKDAKPEGEKAPEKTEEKAPEEKKEEKPKAAEAEKKEAPAPKEKKPEADKKEAPAAKEAEKKADAPEKKEAPTEEKKAEGDTK